ncbi:hypothetical protein SAMN02745163_01266 [Clostridium cavendishii DSM 21758]|uniref:Nucleotidyl transferase AbiEii toxin, Type IV TA system n=1 Tax=Clostridium cavendishii DSM 21758 TaxID=1121302 RepID=A0A1M6GED6_9CLOT|nr:DUF6036 family nucleotidyltransferase [Clostridium cavendishii]SHJ08325.1 hypothetical protein SAMN02745163_01266 [Clostridium cavendishii DSM 21758]
MRRLDLFDSHSKELSKGRLEEIIGLVGDELNNINRNLNIEIYGDSALCLLTNFKEDTFGIDVITKDKKLIKDCFRRCNIWEEIINTEPVIISSNKASLKLYRDYGKLKVYLPTVDYFLAMKLRIMLDDDKEDIISLIKELRISSFEEVREIFIKYYSRLHLHKYRVNFIKELLNEALLVSI